MLTKLLVLQLRKLLISYYGLVFEGDRQVLEQRVEGDIQLPLVEDREYQCHDHDDEVRHAVLRTDEEANEAKLHDIQAGVELVDRFREE